MKQHFYTIKFVYFNYQNRGGGARGEAEKHFGGRPLPHGAAAGFMCLRFSPQLDTTSDLTTPLGCPRGTCTRHSAVSIQLVKGGLFCIFLR